MLALVVVTGCGFHADLAGRDPDAATDGADDAAMDAPPDGRLAQPCDADPDLRLCFSFDQPAFGTTLANQGTAVVDAALTDIERIDRSAGNGAARLGATSSIYVPMHADVSSILAIEVWFRADAMPANGGRMGLVDSNVIPPNISLFFYRQDPAHTLRCGIGNQTEIWAATLVTGSWHYAACTCDGTSLSMWLDGVNLGDRPGGCGSAGALVDDGLTIGSDNTGTVGSYADRLAGAIDALRLWSTARTPAQICAAAGLPSC